MQASRHAASITADVTPRSPGEERNVVSQVGRWVQPSATANSRRAPPAAIPLPISTMARDRIPASTWRGLAPSAVRSPISRVRRETLTDISEKIPSADRNKTSEVTPASAPACTLKLHLPPRIHSSSGRASWTCNLASTSAAMTGRRAASGAGLPRTRTLITSGETVPADAA